METYKVTSPILFLIFNRPEETQKVFEQIRKVRPGRLFIAADGPRENKDGEALLCEKTREIVSLVDWDCEVKTLFREGNLGCKYAVSSAISWFFDQVDEGIILEDDCLPQNDFFYFCDTLLERYRFDSRIMHIGGTNFHKDTKWGDASYYFSNISNVWGWASWKRAWEMYDVELSRYKSIDTVPYFYSIFKNMIIAETWAEKFKELQENKIDTWDYQWTITVMLNNGLTIVPNTNLISNIGFGVNATHTVATASEVANMKVGPIGEITHPVIILAEKAADLVVLNREFRVKRQKRKKVIRTFKFWKK